MFDGRFDQHFLEVFAGRQNGGHEEPLPQRPLGAVQVALILLVLGIALPLGLAGGF